MQLGNVIEDDMIIVYILSIEMILNDPDGRLILVALDQVAHDRVHHRDWKFSLFIDLIKIGRVKILISHCNHVLAYQDLVQMPWNRWINNSVFTYESLVIALQVSLLRGQ